MRTEKDKKNLAELLRDPEKSKKLKIADLIASTALSNSGIPGANAIYDFAKFGVNAVREFLVERQDEKISDFHNAMLTDNSEILDETVVDKNIDIVDYHALLDACISDIEMEKNALYGRLAKSIASGKISARIKRHYTLCLKELTWDQIDLLARLYVHDSFSIKPSQGPGSIDASDKLKNVRHDSIEGLDVSALAAKGFVHGTDLTALSEPFLKAIFPPELLTPAAFNLKVWTGHRFSIIQLPLNGFDTLGVSESIHEYFRNLGVQGGIGPMEGILDGTRSFPFNLFFIIVYPNGKTLSDTRKDNLLEIIKNKAALQIIICEESDNALSPILDIPHIIWRPSDASATIALADEMIGDMIKASRSTKT
ncbi:hypothetical protein J3Q09_26035 [Pseudomonas sp. R4-83]|uniref:hypothetical protein n=1 Tax=unclassified Pseudomonas TaxID=196821 RepID=UPI003DA9F323